MSSNNIELIMLKWTLILFGILILLFIIRTIKIIVTKSISSKEDALCVLFWIVFLLPFAVAYYFISRKFKKEKCTNNCELPSLKK